MELQEGQSVEPQSSQPAPGAAVTPAASQPSTKTTPPSPPEPVSEAEVPVTTPVAPQTVGLGSGFAPHPADETEEQDTSPESFSSPDDASPDDNAEQGRSFVWQASEYVQHHKSPTWYFGLVSIVLLGAAILAYFKQFTALAVVVVMAIAVVIISLKPPRTLQYSLDEYGLQIDDKVFPYESFKSYSVFEEVGWHTIDLESAKRLVPRLSIICENDTFDTIESILSEQLPRHDRKPDWIERLTQYLHF